MVFNATFNNILAIPWRSVLLVEETGVPGQNHRPTASSWQTVFLQEFTLFSIESYVFAKFPSLVNNNNNTLYYVVEYYEYYWHFTMEESVLWMLLTCYPNALK
jgi:hypothetical protein